MPISEETICEEPYAKKPKVADISALKDLDNHPLNTHFLFLDHHREYTSNPEEIHNSFFVPESYGRNSDI
jgi:hypothetical protein